MNNNVLIIKPRFVCALLACIAVANNTHIAAQVIPPSQQPGTLGRQFEKTPRPKSTGKLVLPKPAEQPPPGVAGEYRFTLKGMNIEGDSVYDRQELSEYYLRHINKEIDVKTLFTIASEITRRYAEDGYALSLAFVPAQEIEQEAHVKIIIIEGYFAEIEYKGATDALSARIKRQLNSLLQERPLTVSTMERQLLLVSDNPTVDITTTVDRSSIEVGGAKLIVNAIAKPHNFSIGINNRGTRASGPLRMDFGIQLSSGGSHTPNLLLS